MGRMIPLTRDDAWDYVLEANRSDPPEQQVVFRLRPLSAAQRARIADSIAADVTAEGTTSSVNIKVGSRWLLACRDGLTGWIAGPEAAEDWPAFQVSRSGGASEASLDVLRDEWLSELGTEILNRSSLTSEERGK